MSDGEKWGVFAMGSAPSRRQWVAGAAAALAGFSVRSTMGRELFATSAAENGVTRTAEAIHQETTYKAPPSQVYEALTDAAQFQKVELASGAMKAEELNAVPAKISSEPGGSFSTFGGLIVGRLLELARDERIVQAWRPAYWEPGLFSMVRFQLLDAGAGTRLVLDHRGFPDGDSRSLLDGWTKNYWQPLAKYLIGS